MPKVSVIVAVYNIEQYIRRCIDSLVLQTLDEIEIILVDDKSTDMSGEICDEYAIMNDKIKVIHKLENEGLSEARNTGIKVSRGEYLAFVDGDDYVEPNTYLKAYEKAKSTNADSVIFGYYNDRKKGQEKHEKTDVCGIYRGEDVIRKLFPMIIGTKPTEKYDYAVGFAPWAQLIKKATIEKNNISFKSERILIYEDLMFALDFYPKVNSVTVMKDAFYHYCENGQSLTNSVKIDRYERVKCMYEYLKSKLEYSMYLFDDCDVNIRFKRTILSYIRLCVMQLSSDAKYIGKIKEITHDTMCVEVMKGYPVWKLPIKQAVFAFCLKYKLGILLYLITSSYKR